MNYHKDKAIDWDALHFEWARQPELAHEYGVELADAKRAVDNAKEALDVAKAKAYLKASELGLKVDNTKAEAELDANYQHHVREYSNAKHFLGLVQAAYDAITQTKRKALEALVSLHGQQYWSAPVEQKDYEQWCGKKFGQEAQQQRREKATEASKAAAARRTRGGAK